MFITAEARGGTWMLWVEDGDIAPAATVCEDTPRQPSGPISAVPRKPSPCIQSKWNECRREVRHKSIKDWQGASERTISVDYRGRMKDCVER